MPGPLDGVRIFDMTLAMVGPFSTKELGSMGADVIRIEAPAEERPMTGVPPYIKGTSIGYINWNFNKRGIILNFKAPKDREVGYKLLKTCDVFVENMRPGAVERLGFGYDHVKEINPSIVYVAVSGYGQRGPMVPVPGADTMIQVFGAWTSTTGEPGGKYQVYRHHTQIDSNTSNYIVQSVLLGLLARDKTGKGQKIEVDMTSAIIALQSSRIAEFFATGKTPPLMGSGITTVVPHQAFICQDKAWVFIGIEKEEQWAPFCKVMKLDHLTNDARFRTNRDRVVNRDQLVPMLEEAFKTKPRYHWIMELNEVGVPAGKQMEWDEIRFHPQTAANQHILEIPTRDWGTVFDGGPPWKFSDTPARVFQTPVPGEHTDEILAEIGLNREDLAPRGS